MLRRIFFCGLAALLLFAAPSVAADLYFSEFKAGTVRILDTKTLAVKPFASGLKEPFAIAFLPGGDLLAASAGEGKIVRISPSGAKSTFSSGFAYPVGIAVHPVSGDVFVSDFALGVEGKGSVWKVTQGGAKTLLVGGLTGPAELVFDDEPIPNLLLANYAGGPDAVSKISPLGVVSPLVPSSGYYTPYGIIATGGDVLVGFFYSARVMRKSGSDAPVPLAQGALLYGVMSLRVGDGSIWYANQRRGSIGKLGVRLGAQTGTPVELVAGLKEPTGVAFKP